MLVGDFLAAEFLSSFELAELFVMSLGSGKRIGIWSEVHVEGLKIWIPVDVATSLLIRKRPSIIRGIFLSLELLKESLNGGLLNLIVDLTGGLQSIL